MRTAIVLVVLCACASLPDTHRYALSPPDLAPLPAPNDAAPVLTVEELEIDSAYDDERIAYRPDPQRFEYYDYHLWASSPSLAVTDYLRSAFMRSARFSRVTREQHENADVVLRGRITAIEEVDVGPRQWIGRVALELELEDARTGALLWSQAFAEQIPLREQSPAGVARAVQHALARIARKALPDIARHANDAKIRHDSLAPEA